jgi:hypothetical protein
MSAATPWLYKMKMVRAHKVNTPHPRTNSPLPSTPQTRAPSVPTPRYCLGVPQRPIRSLAVVGVLALGDYLLWKWSLGANHDVVALVSGMTLIPLLIALAWLTVVAGVRLLASLARRSTPILAARARGAAGTTARPRNDARAADRVPAPAAGRSGLADPASAYAATALADPVPAAAAASPPSTLAA